MEFVSAKPAQSPARCWGNSTSPCRQLSFACFAACFLVLAQTYLANSASLWGRACIPTCSYTTYCWHESWILKSTSVQHSHALAQTLSIKFLGTCFHASIHASECTGRIAGLKLVIQAPSESCEHAAENLDIWKRMSPSNLYMPGRQSWEELIPQTNICSQTQRGTAGLQSPPICYNHCPRKGVVFHGPKTQYVTTVTTDIRCLWHYSHSMSAVTKCKVGLILLSSSKHWLTLNNQKKNLSGCFLLISCAGNEH